MRASPAFQVSLQRFGVWRGGVRVVALLGAATLCAWLLTSPRPLAAARIAAVIAALVAIAATARSLARIPASRLLWDGRQWSLVRPDSSPVACPPVVGELQVAVDLGPWMLLRFISTASGGAARSTWLPVQRRGLESQWHALRCAVHATRSGATGATGDAPEPPKPPDSVMTP